MNFGRCRYGTVQNKEKILNTTLKNGKEYSSLEAAYDAYLKALEQYDSVRQP